VGVRRIGRAVTAVLVAAAIFWAGQESSHGLSAFGEHWWCPVPLIVLVAGLGLLVVTRPSGQPA
jgi:hypothetical protein